MSGPAEAEVAAEEEVVPPPRAPGDARERHEEAAWFHNFRLRRFAAAFGRVLEVALIGNVRAVVQHWQNWDCYVLEDEFGEKLVSPESTSGCSSSSGPPSVSPPVA